MSTTEISEPLTIKHPNENLQKAVLSLSPDGCRRFVPKVCRFSDILLSESMHLTYCKAHEVAPPTPEHRAPADLIVNRQRERSHAAVFFFFLRSYSDRLQTENIMREQLICDDSGVGISLVSKGSVESV